MNEVEEALADYAHRAWSDWMRWMHAVCSEGADGTIVVPSALVARWKRQMLTPYGELPESEKASDREQARAILAVINKAQGTGESR